MAANKISYCGKVLLDLTSDTITPEKLAKGVTAHTKDGSKITGTLEIVQKGNWLSMPEGIGRYEENYIHS